MSEKKWPNNQVACVNCKSPVKVTALNAIRCDKCSDLKWHYLGILDPKAFVEVAEILRSESDAFLNNETLTPMGMERFSRILEAFDKAKGEGK